MVVQYPHSAVVTSLPTSSIDTNGDAVSVAGTANSYGCRIEKISGGVITRTDGRQDGFSWIVYFPLPAAVLTEGEGIQVYDNSSLIASGTIKQFLKSQLNAKAWI